MTVTTTATRTSTAGDGVVTAFSFPYKFFANDDLTVILVVDSTGVETTQTITTHYTVTGAGLDAGGTVTMVTAPAVGETLVITREEQFTQGLDLVENDPFPSDLVEQQFDTVTMLAQQLDTRVDRSVRLSEGDTTGASTVLATPVADAYIMWSSDGLSLTSNPTADAGQLLGGDGTELLPRYSFNADPNTGMYRIGADNVGFSMGGSKVLDIDTSGINAAIGQTTAAAGAFTSITLTTDLAVAHGGTGASTFTDGGILLGSGTGAVTATAALADGEMIVGDGTTDPAIESGATLRTSIGVGTGDSPQFTGIELGHATDTTLTRASAGDMNIEGNIVYRAGGTDVPVTDGGTGASTFTDGGILLGSGTGAITATAALADGEMLVGDGTTDPAIESGATLRTSIGVGTGDSPSFAGLTLASALTVANGGTGAATLTDGGILLGSGTGAITATAALADGEMLVGDGTTDPVLESGATLRTSIGVGTGDNVQFTDITATGAFTSLGIDDNATTNAITISSDEEVTLPGTPSFQGRTNTLSNVTGDGTAYTVLFPTERFDVGGNFASPTYTAPITGKYLHTLAIEIRGLTGSHTDLIVTIVTSNREYGMVRLNPSAIAVSGIMVFNGTMYADMDAADTATIRLTVSGGTKVVDIDEAYWSVALVH